MIESYWGNENAGARRHYHLTEKGRALFAENPGGLAQIPRRDIRTV